jgi:NAD/NADP transhydrogenase alpha subunit
MRLVIPREITPGETRVSLVPETVAKLVKSGFQVAVEAALGSPPPIRTRAIPRPAPRSREKRAISMPPPRWW